MIRRGELDRMEQSLNSLVVDAQSVAPTELRAIEGFAGGNAAHERDAGATIRWRVGLSSSPPSILRVAVSMRVEEVLDEILRQKPTLRQRAPWRIATVVDDALQPLPSDVTLDCLGVTPGGSVGLVLVPDERQGNRPSAASIQCDTRARAVAARASSSRELFATDPAPDRDGVRQREGFTLLYRIGRGRAAPRSMRAGPLATVMDVLEEIAEQDPAIAIRLKAGERLQLTRGEDQEVLDHHATLQTLGFKPGGTFPVCVL
jgi:hypothetical protein